MSRPLTNGDKSYDTEKSQHVEAEKQPKVIPAYIIIPTWITISTCVILYNKYIFTGLNFPYPVFLTTFHLFFAAGVTRLLKRFTHLIDEADRFEMTVSEWAKSILPIGALFSGSLVLSNQAYLTLSVSFIQMLKAFMPVAILLISFATGMQRPNMRLTLIVLMISSGTAMAAYGELHFEPGGFFRQCGAIAFESTRLLMVQKLLQGKKMDPLVSLHFFAPVCAVINLIILAYLEGTAPFYDLSKVGIGNLLLNASIAFALNVSAVFLISWSGLILTLSGIVKDIIIIGGSMLAFHTTITPMQFLGYSVSLTGLVLFKTTGSK